MIANVLKDAIPHLKFPSSTFELAYKKALYAILEDAEASTYTPSPGNEDAYDFLAAVLEDIDAANNAEVEEEDDDDEDGEIETVVEVDEDDDVVTLEENDDEE